MIGLLLMEMTKHRNKVCDLQFNPVSFWTFNQKKGRRSYIAIVKLYISNIAVHGSQSNIIVS